MQEKYWGRTYRVDEEMLAIHPLLKAAVEYQRTVEDYLIPYSYWTDQHGKLYIKWNMYDKEADKPVCRYWFEESGKLVTEVVYGLIPIAATICSRRNLLSCLKPTALS